MNGEAPEVTFAVALRLTVTEPDTVVFQGEAGVMLTEGGGGGVLGPTAVTFRLDVAVLPATSVALT